MLPTAAAVQLRANETNRQSSVLVDQLPLRSKQTAKCTTSTSRTSPTGSDANSEGSGSNPTTPSRHVQRSHSAGHQSTFLLTFPLPQVEMAYRIACWQQWQCHTDVLYVCLLLVPLSGSWILRQASGSFFLATIACLLSAGAILGVLKQLHASSPRDHLTVREVAWVVIRLLHVFSLVSGNWPWMQALDQFAIGKLGNLEPKVTPAVIMLCSHAVLGQLRAFIHFPVQLLCTSTLTAYILQHDSAQTSVDTVKVCVQNLLLGMLLPTMCVYMLEQQSRAAFWRRIQ